MGNEKREERRIVSVSTTTKDRAFPLWEGETEYIAGTTAPCLPKQHHGSFLSILVPWIPLLPVASYSKIHPSMYSGMQ